MKINKFAEHNEGLKGIHRDQALKHIDAKLEKLKNGINEPNFTNEVFVDLLINIYHTPDSDGSEIASDLIKNGIEIADLLYILIEYAENNSNDKFKRILHNTMYNMVEKNKEYLKNNSAILSDLGL